jgi:hypothetical protein
MELIISNNAAITSNRKLAFVGYGDYFPIADKTKVGSYSKK